MNAMTFSGRNKNTEKTAETPAARAAGRGGLKTGARFTVYSGIIAALYCALTLLLAPISFGLVQCRLSEALFVLPCFTAAGVPGLFLGCFLSSLLIGAPVWDTVVGSAATLAAAFLTRVLAKRGASAWVLPLPTVVLNAVFIGALMRFVYAESLPLPLCMLYIGLGEALCCYALGLPLRYLLKRNAAKIFREVE